MRAFLNQPVEAHTGVIECMIRRKKGVMNTVYQAFYEVSVACLCRGTGYEHRLHFVLMCVKCVVRRKNARRADGPTAVSSLYTVHGMRFRDSELYLVGKWNVLSTRHSCYEDRTDSL